MIEAAINVACDVLPLKGLKNVCHKFVSTFAPRVIKLIAKGLKPDEICHIIGICQKKEVAMLPEPAPLPWIGYTYDGDVGLRIDSGLVEEPESALNNPTTEVEDINDKTTAISSGLPIHPMCKVCKIVVKHVIGVVKDITNEKMIEAAMNVACDELPLKGLKNVCHKFVGTFTPTVVKLIAKGLKPDEICHVIGICPKKEVAMLPEPAPLPWQENKDGDFRYAEQGVADVNDVPEPCMQLCEVVISKVELVIGNKKNRQEVWVALDKLCREFALSVDAYCLLYVSDHIDKIIYFLSNKFTPKQVCTALKICK